MDGSQRVPPGDPRSRSPTWAPCSPCYFIRVFAPKSSPGCLEACALLAFPPRRPPLGLMSGVALSCHVSTGEVTSGDLWGLEREDDHHCKPACISAARAAVLGFVASKPPTSAWESKPPC